MTILHRFFVRPFTARGFWWGLTDVLVKIATVVVWAYLTCVQISLVWQSIRLDYNPMNQLWWFSYAFLMLFGASLLAYILLFVRDYDREYDAEETAEEE